MRNSSLRRLLLRRLLLPMVPILTLGIGMAYLFALHAANAANDLGLVDDALDLVKQVQVRGNKLSLELPSAALQMLSANNDDHVTYAAWDKTGLLFAGNAQLSRLARPSVGANYTFQDIEVDGKKNRAVVLSSNVAGIPLTIAVAETVHGRDRISDEIFLSMLFPEIALAVVSLAVILFGVRHGLSPVELLRDEILRRSPNDLSAIDESPAPEELRPIVHSINTLLEKLTSEFAIRKRFIADAAHQLRTPLAALSSQIEVALKKPSEDSRETLRQLLKTTRRTHHLIHQLLSLARLEHMQIATTEDRIDLCEVIREAAGDFVASSADKGVELTFDLKPCRVQGSTFLLGEMLANLLDNAIRYVPSGGQVIVSLRDGSDHGLLSIEDNGPGVPEDELATLGIPFHRQVASFQEGCGLGLAIVKEIVRLHQASIRFGLGHGGQGLKVDILLPHRLTQSASSGSYGNEPG